MQDEINDKAINLAARIGEITVNEIKKAAEKLIASLTERKDASLTANKAPELKHGKQTLKQLVGLGQGHCCPCRHVMCRICHSKRFQYRFHREQEFYQLTDQRFPCQAFQSTSAASIL